MKFIAVQVICMIAGQMIQADPPMTIGLGALAGLVLVIVSNVLHDRWFVEHIKNTQS